MKKLIGISAIALLLLTVTTSCSSKKHVSCPAYGNGQYYERMPY